MPPSPPICRVLFEPSGLKTEVSRGSTLLEAAGLAGVYLSSVCGGDGTCGKCRVAVSAGQVEPPPASPDELVLACRTAVLTDVTVAVPHEHRLDTGRILVGVDTHHGPHEAVAGLFPLDPLRPDTGPAAACRWSVAVDVGTTTVVAHLLDLETGATAGAEAAYNSQMHFGDDYIRRIMYAEAEGGWTELQRRVVADINGLVAALASRHGLMPDDVGAVVCSGNTAMIHFLLGLEAGWIRRGQENPDGLRFAPRPAREVGLRIHEAGLLYVLPAVGAYVGGDIVAGVLATRMDDAAGLRLLIDIGTNGEVVLGGREWMACASSSAGPAFEGSGVRHGMRATAGAIERLSFTPQGEVRYRTVGDEPPRGLCGSGLMDTLAGLLGAGIIDRAGRFADRGDPRLAEGPDGPEFTLVPAAGGRGAIVITQADILNLVRSKAGVYSAIDALLAATGTAPADLESIDVAGGFGHHLDPAKAVAIGMLPDVPADRIRFVGNSSVAGAKMAALSRAAYARAGEIAGRMTYFDLMTHPGYMDAFIQANFLPHTDLARFPSAARAAGAAGQGTSA